MVLPARVNGKPISKRRWRDEIGPSRFGDRPAENIAMTIAAAVDASDIRLYLATPPISDATIASELGELVACADIAAVLVRLAPASERTLLNCLKALAPVIQNAGVAMLLDGRPDLVARSGADGVHITGVDQLAEVMSQMKPDRIVGVGGLHSRHDAMVAGEAGADYVMFGEPDIAGVIPSQSAVIERIGWWSEVFVLPCVGYAPTRVAVSDIVEANPDFVLLDDAIWKDPHGARAALSDASATIEAYNERAATAHKAARR